MKDLKISFLGDIMFEQQFVRASKLGKDTYNFDSLFEEIKPLLALSDYVVANLETVCAGRQHKLSNEIYSFNSPDEVLDSIKDAGISMVTTANNHSLDRGIDGLLRTLEELNKRQIDHTGSFSDAKQENKFLVKEFDGKRIAFLSYTYGTNYTENNVLLKPEEVGHLNLLKPQTVGKMQLESKKTVHPFKKSIVKILQAAISSDHRMRIKKMLGLPLNVPITDIISDGDLDENYLSELAKQITNAKKASDYVFYCIHNGGQFNDKPGDYSEYIMNFAIEKGADAIIGAHPHVVQKAELINGKPVFFSLGNFSFSPSSIYVLHELLPEYSIVPHFYFKNLDSGLTLKSVTYSILKTIEHKDRKVSVHDTYDLLNRLDSDNDQLRKDISFINSRIGNNLSVNDIGKKEYVLFEL